MGNTESGHRNDSDGEDEPYNYHKVVLKEGSTPVKGHRQEHLQDTPESSNDGFVDARDVVNDEEEESEVNSTSFTGSEGSSHSGSMSNITHSSHSTDRSHDTSHSDVSPGTSYGSVNGYEALPGNLPNRIRVIDTSDSEGEEETEPATSNNNPRKQLDFSDTNVSRKGHLKTLPRPIPIHKIPSDISQRQSSNGDGEIPERSQQVKRKADDMETEAEDDNRQMVIPVKKNGGACRPFARKKHLRDIVVGHQVSVDPVPGTSADMTAGTSDRQISEQKNKRIAQIDEEFEKMDDTENRLVVSEIQKEGSLTKFEHSNHSPFKNFQLQPSSSSTAGADLSATAETPRGKTEVNNTPLQISQTIKFGSKRSSDDPDPSTSRTANEGKDARTASQSHVFNMQNKPSVSGFSGSSRSEHPGRTIPSRGNSGEGPSGSQHSAANAGQGSQERVYGHHWTSELPRVNVAAAEKRYEGATVSRHSPAPSTSEWHNNVLRHKGDRFSFMLADTLNVHICCDDITSLRTDALINPTDGQLTHVNDIARSIAMATGAQMTNQCQFFLRQNHGPLETTEVIETYACGSLSGRVGHVIHLATPTYEAANEKSSVNKLLQSYLNCLNHINDNLGLVSVVFPCIGAGSYPQDTCINIFFESLLVHLAERKSSRIKTVKFVVSDVHLGNLAIAMIQAHLERGILEGIDVLMAEALNSYYGNSKWECNQNDLNDQLGRQLEVDSPKRLFRGPPVKRPRL